MHTPQTDRYFVDGNSKTQQKIVLTVLTTCKQFFWEILTWKLKRLLYMYLKSETRLPTHFI